MYSSPLTLHLLKVLWLGKPEAEVTWEAVESLNPQVVADFESGTSMELTAQTTTCYGQVATTLMVEKRQETPQAKKGKKERPCISAAAG